MVDSEGGNDKNAAKDELIIESLDAGSIPAELADGELFGKDEDGAEKQEKAAAEKLKEEQKAAEEKKAKKAKKVQKTSKKDEVIETPDFVLNELSEAAAEMDEMDGMFDDKQEPSAENSDEEDFSYLFTDELAHDEEKNTKKTTSPKKSIKPAEKIEKKEKIISVDAETEPKFESEDVEEAVEAVEGEEVDKVSAEGLVQKIEDNVEDNNETSDDFQAIVSAATTLADEDDVSGYYLFGSQSDDFGALNGNLEDLMKAEEEFVKGQEEEKQKAIDAEKATVVDAPDYSEFLIGEKTTFSYGFGDGKKTFADRNGLGTVILNNVGDIGLEGWKIVLSETKIIPLFDMAGMTLEIPKGDNIRGTLVGENAETISLFNVDKFIIPVDSESSIAEANSGAIMTGDFKVSELDVWNLVLTDTRIISLSEAQGNVIEFPKQSSMNGSLIGPDNHELKFFGVERFVIEVDDLQTADLGFAEDPDYKNLYEPVGVNYKEESVYSYSESMGKQEFEANDNVSVVQLITGVDGVYGWNIMFENGVKMGLYDLIKYQSKYGSIPDANGVLIRGASALKFKGVTRVAIYKKPMYNGYFYGLSA